MSPSVDRTTELTILRKLVQDALSQTPSSLEGGLEQQAAARYLQRKIDELKREVITGD